jgi:chromosome partitioning protein
MTMFDPRTNLSAQVVEEVGRHFPRERFHTVIPRSVRLGEAPSYGEPITRYAPTSPGALAYRALASELVRRLGPTNGRI